MIVKAAIRKNGKIYTGHRHHNILGDAKPFGSLKGGEQGFVTENYEFVNREVAAKIAFECGQIPRPKKILFSEDIY